MKKISNEEKINIIKQYLLFDLGFEVEVNNDNNFIFKRNLGRQDDYLIIEFNDGEIRFKIEMSSSLEYKSSRINIYIYGLDILHKLSSIVEFAKYFAFHYSIKY